MTLSNPTLLTLFFFSEHDLPRSKEQYPEAKLARTLGVTLEAQQPGISSCHGKLAQEVEAVVTACMAHDTDITSLKICIPGEGSPTSWQRLLEAEENVVKDLVSGSDHKPWAVSRIFCAEVTGSSPSRVLADHFRSLANLLKVESTADRPDSTPFGWLWTVAERVPAPDEHPGIARRDLLLLIPVDRAANVYPVFIDPMRQGLSRIELYLQKCQHHARQHEIVRNQLSRAMQTLQQSMVSQLGDIDFSQIQKEPVALEQISQHLMRFMAQKAALELLTNSLRSNLSALTEHLARVRLETPSYTLEKEKMRRQIEQMESDLTNAAVIQESTTSFQDIQRSAESNRFERASYLLGGTAALLAGISLFNSLLDIWSLSLENSGWDLPASWLRILLSLAASVAIPLAATWFIARKKKPAIICLVISLAALAGMLLSTLLVNL